MATSVMVPLEEYLRTSYEPDCEWIDGEVRERGVRDRIDDYVARGVKAVWIVESAPADDGYGGRGWNPPGSRVFA